MYSPKPFAIEDSATIEAFLAEHGFGQLVSQHQGRLFSTYLPFLYDPKNRTLTGHLARLNPQHQDLSEQEVMVTFSGPHGYISPSWYAVHNVPTWNYQALHIYGRCEVFTDVDRLAAVVRGLTEQHESDQPDPWQADYPASMLQAIIGIKISIQQWHCKFKLNQNRSVADMQGVMAHLNPIKDAELLAAMEQALQRKQAT